MNLRSVAKNISDLDDLVILCSGNNGLFSYEDSVCAGGLISEIKKLNIQLDLNDASKTCLFLFEKHSSDLGNMLKETEHGKFLIKEGFSEDLIYSAKKDLISAVPVFSNGAIKLKK